MENKEMVQNIKQNLKNAGGIFLVMLWIASIIAAVVMCVATFVDTENILTDDEKICNIIAKYGECDDGQPIKVYKGFDCEYQTDYFDCEEVCDDGHRGDEWIPKEYVDCLAIELDLENVTTSTTPNCGKNDTDPSIIHIRDCFTYDYDQIYKDLDVGAFKYQYIIALFACLGVAVVGCFAMTISGKDDGSD